MIRGTKKGSPQRVTAAERVAPVAEREAAGDFGDRLFSNKPQKLEG